MLQMNSTLTNIRISKILLILGIIVHYGNSGFCQNLNVLTYNNTTNTVARTIDGSVLDAVFATVNGDGAVRTADWAGPSNNSSSLPSSVSGFNGIDLVIVRMANGILTYAQLDALIEFVTNGGILIYGAYGTGISGSGGILASTYLANSLFCGTENVTRTQPFAHNNDVNAYHPGNGCLLLNSNGATTTPVNSNNIDYFYNVPSESAIMLAELSVTNTCTGPGVLDFIVPPLPGLEMLSNTCGIEGFAIFCGDNLPPLASGNSSVPRRGNTQLNVNYAQLIYDFLFDPAAMKARYCWARTSSNINTSCPPDKIPCRCSAPALSTSSLSNICPSYFADLSALTASNIQTSVLTCHTATPVDSSNLVSNSSAITAGTYHAAFNDEANGCNTYDFSESDSVSVSISPCCEAGNQPPIIIKQ